MLVACNRHKILYFAINLMSRIIWYQNATMIKKTIFEPKYKSLIESLKSLRKKQGISQRELAKRLGQTHCYVGRTETCERRLDIIDLVNILKALDLSDKEILQFFKQII